MSFEIYTSKRLGMAELFSRYRKKSTSKPLTDAQKEANKQKAKERKEQIRQENLAQAELVRAKRSFDPMQNPRLARLAKKQEPRSYSRLRVTPSWADKSKIDEIYAERDRLNTEISGDPYEVDHFYPVMGETVCGLHVESNLRIIRKSENLKKTNVHPEDLASHVKP